MNIPYVTRSRFLGVLEKAIRSWPEDQGESLQVMLDGDGYAGCVTVTIRDGDSGPFGTDWEASDPTRFPARIKAAATALFNCGCRGRYEIRYNRNQGSLVIRRAVPGTCGG